MFLHLRKKKCPPYHARVLPFERLPSGYSSFASINLNSSTITKLTSGKETDFRKGKVSRGEQDNALRQLYNYLEIVIIRIVVIYGLLTNDCEVSIYATDKYYVSESREKIVCLPIFLAVAKKRKSSP